MTESLAIRMSTAHDRAEWLVIDDTGAPRGVDSRIVVVGNRKK